MNGRTLRWLLTLARPPAALDGGSRGASRLTIIRHHRVYADGERPLYRLGVAAPVLQAQLQLLERHGLRPVTVEEGLRHLDEGGPGHRVAMSFDDGYADNLHRALPLLAAAGARATFYLTAGLLERREPAWWDVVADALERTRLPALEWRGEAGPSRLPVATRGERARALRVVLPDFRVEPGRRAERITALRTALAVSGPVPCELMSWEEAGALRDAGMEIGAHTLSHPHLSLLDAARQREEIAGSVELIGRRLGLRPAGLAYPGGDFDARTVEAAVAAGLAYAVTTRAGDNRRGAARFELRRRGFSEGACMGPGGRFSPRLAMAELEGAFDRLRGALAGGPS
jgi:peptidoglycan/xylan/chitin deacetylase (PgdA/CDA1 family)